MKSLKADLSQFSEKIDSMKAVNEARFSQLKTHIEQAALNVNTKVQQIEKVVEQNKLDARSLIQQGFEEREANLESKLEYTKQQFLKAINSNMRILDNLINDYTNRTHDQIKQQLKQSGSSGQNSRAQMHNNEGQLCDAESQ